MLCQVKDLGPGYRVSHGKQLGRSSIALHQKRVRNDQGETLYFINIYEYNPSYLPEVARDRHRFDCEVDLFTVRDDDYQVHHRIGLTPAEFDNIHSFEGHINMIYFRLGCIPDPHNQ